MYPTINTFSRDNKFYIEVTWCGYPLNGLVFIQRTRCNTSDTTEKRKFLLCGIASPYRELLSHKHWPEGAQ